MAALPAPLQRVVERLSRLPGIGEKTASRLAFNLLNRPREQVIALAESLLEMKERVGLCAECFGLSDHPRCHVCEDPAREREVICVVEGPADLMAIERARSFNGVYHVLHGSLSPVHGVGPEQLRTNNLVRRIESGEVDEIIVATNPTVEGEATAVYLSRLIKSLRNEVKVTRIATGIPVGSDIEYADEVTMMKAMEGRREL